MSSAGLLYGSPAFRRSRILGTVFLAVPLLYTLLPLVYLVIAATKTQADLFETFGFALGHRMVLWHNLRAVFAFQDGIFGRWLLNTALYSGVSALGATVV